MDDAEKMKRMEKYLDKINKARAKVEDFRERFQRIIKKLVYHVYYLEKGIKLDDKQFFDGGGYDLARGFFRLLYNNDTGNHQSIFTILLGSKLRNDLDVGSYEKVVKFFELQSSYVKHLETANFELNAIPEKTFRPLLEQLLLEKAIANTDNSSGTYELKRSAGRLAVEASTPDMPEDPEMAEIERYIREKFPENNSQLPLEPDPSVQKFSESEMNCWETTSTTRL